MGAGDAIIRGETWKLSFGPETVYGTDPGTDYLKTVFGVVQSANMPDPSVEYQPIWALGSASKRNFYITYKNKLTLAGGIPDVWLLNATPLYLPLGTYSTVGTDDGAGGSTLDGATTVGDTSFDVVDATGYANDDYIQVGVTTLAEVRKITNITTNTITVDFPLQFAHANGIACNKVIAPFTHTLTESSTLCSFTMQHEMFDADGNSELQRRWSGGKVGRASLSCTEGDMLKMSLDEMVFNSYKVDGGSGMATVNVEYPTTEPYLFSYGALTLWGTEFARVKSFNLDISNALEPKYYMTDDATARLPYEIREGRRDYRVSVTVDIADSTLFDELVKMGVNHGSASDDAFKGFDMSLVFTRGTNDTITITLPPTSAAAGGDAQGCFIRSAPHNLNTEQVASVPLDILARSVGISVVDSKYMPWSA